ncbi:MAG: hypothetical protein KAR79_06075, partial [Simkaniaceae bacterium]|nr:hypothetical protein [Simkaniaceae bacterium]
RTNPNGIKDAPCHPRGNGEESINEGCTPVPMPNNDPYHPRTNPSGIKDAPCHPRENGNGSSSCTPAAPSNCEPYHPRSNQGGKDVVPAHPRAAKEKSSATDPANREDGKSPILWSFFSHLVYGFVLGLFYRPKKRNLSAENSN